MRYRNDYEDVGEADWNMGADYLSRLNVLLYYYNEASRLRDVKNMFVLLERIFAEIAPMMDEETRNKHHGTRTDLNEQYKKWQSYQRNTARNKRYVQYNPPEDIFDGMFKWEIDLRNHIKKVGMLIPLKDKRLAAAKGEFG